MKIKKVEIIKEGGRGMGEEQERSMEKEGFEVEIM